MKVFISADIEGVNSICDWSETEYGTQRYFEFKKQMTEEVKMAAQGAKNANATEILIKDAHDSALNLSIQDLPEYVKLHRGWGGGPCSMMGGLDETFDAVVYIGYHSPSRSNGNPLSHTLNTKIQHIKINGVIASEFDINSFYASYLNVPIAFLSGDEYMTELVQTVNKNIDVVATKTGVNGAVISKHPSITNKEILEGVEASLKKSNLKKNIVQLPKSFNVEVQYRSHQDAYNASFFPGCKLQGTDRVIFTFDNFYNVLVTLKFIL